MSRPLRIAILADSPLPALRDGAQGRGAGQGATWLPPLAHAFEAYKDLEITWIALDSPSTTRADESIAGQRFLIRPHLKPTYDILTGYRAARWHLQKLLREIQPDVVHAWGSERFYPSVIQGLKVPSVLSIQGNMTHYAELGGLPDNWFWKRQGRYEQRWVKHASVIACESPWSREIALGYWPGIDARVIEWGVHPSFYDVPWLPEPGTPYLLFCGGLEWRKGLDVLFDALDLLPNRSWTLRVAGEGPMRERLKSLGLPKVEWLGNLKWDAVKQQMAGAWGLVMPTRADTGPSVVKEARVIGMPVIGSVHGGLRDYIIPGENGLHVEPLTAAYLASAMEDLMGDFDRMHLLGVRRREADRTYFRPERTATAFHQLYRELAER
jgi:glycosyltransferase involved in cell wall biosynthesis